MTDNIRTGLLGAFRRLMRPLVRILIRHGVIYDDFCALLKTIYVESAQEDFAIGNKDASATRVSILTGLSRESVEKQQEVIDRGDLIPTSHLNQITRILVGWHTDTRYTGPYGLPIELDLSASTGTSFTELVNTHCPEIKPAEMLSELLRVSAVEKTPGNKYRVLMRAYIPDSLRSDGLERMGEVVANFIGTIETNMEKRAVGAGRFERVVFADDGLSPNLMRAFDSLLRQKGQQLLEELDNWISSQSSESTIVGTEGNIQTGVGIYHYVKDKDAD